MAVSIFDDKSIVPNAGMVSDALASVSALWDELENHIRDEYPNVSGEWKDYGKASGWTYLLRSKKRTLIYLIPNSGYFRVRIVLGDKAIACAETTELPGWLKDAIGNATPYVEGRSVDINICRHDELEAVKRLAKIKFEN